MNIKIGEIHKVVNNADNPFFEPYHVEVLDIKDNESGKTWIKYSILIRINGQLERGCLTATEELQDFKRMFAPTTLRMLNNNSCKCVKNAIGSLEVTNEND